MDVQTINTLMIQNIKGIKQIKIVAGEVNEICGANGAGKSSILDSIAFAFGGKKIIDKKALRDGEKNGVIHIETSDLIITRKFTESGTTLTVKGKDGGKYAQKDLSSIFNMISFDPLEFSRAGKEDQVGIIKSILGKDFNESMRLLNVERDQIYASRTDIGRRGKDLGEIELPEKVERVDVSQLMGHLDRFEQDNERASVHNEKIDRGNDSLNDYKSKIEGLKAQMVALKDEYKQTCDNRDSMGHWVDRQTRQEFKDTKDIKDKITNASNINDQASQYDQAIGRIKEKDLLKSQYQQKTDDIKAIEEKKTVLMNSADIPVPGLTLGDDGVMIDDIPISQISSAEKLMLSTKIACSINSDLKIILIKDGSLLDKDSFDLITEYSKSNGYQLWIETVGGGVTADHIKISEGVIL